MLTNKILANAIRFLSIDAIEQANSGHPGAPMGMADIAEVLWRDCMNHNPKNPNWINRDRFILSNGHASMMLYSLLHLTGYNLPIKELKNFRRLNYYTPGHPEYGSTPGVESTTGPLGQGLANAVGIAISEKILSKTFNKKNHNIINHYTYVFVGDGCLMEGISHEVCSLAGTFKLKKLIVFYDDNGISIDGKTKHWFTENTEQRFKAYNWNVINNIDGHDRDQIKIAIEKAKQSTEKPSILICKTTIGWGSTNKSGSEKIHGFPLNKKEISEIRAKLNWKYPPFVIPKKIYKKWDCQKKGEKKELIWNKKLSIYKKKFPDLSKELFRRIKGNLPDNWKPIIKNYINKLQKNYVDIPTRKASQDILEIINKILPELLGGSADLTPSTLSSCSTSIAINFKFPGNYIHYGAREFGMSAIMNGIALYKGFIPYGSTFLIFSDYAKNAIRMAALMKIHCIFIYTHDSIKLGEDGPTHQPIEQLSNLRTIPNLITWRPCDRVESAVSWKYAIENNNGPTALIFSRQVLKQQIRNKEKLKNIEKGAYILCENHPIPEIILISTGSEINLTIHIYKILKKEKYKIRVVSIPSTNVFDKQNEIYKESILPNSIKFRVAIEASSSEYWRKYVGASGIIIGMNTFGASGTEEELVKKFKFNVENVISKIKLSLKKN